MTHRLFAIDIAVLALIFWVLFTVIPPDPAPATVHTEASERAANCALVRDYLVSVGSHACG